MASSQHEAPVQYGGRQFASRRAAQWAVFFDTLHIAWQTPPVYFQWPGRPLYRPDFWLPDLRAWVEVRPAGPLGPHTLGAAADLARLHRELVYVFAGAVWPAAQRAAGSPVCCAPRVDLLTGAWTVLAFPDAAWTECPTCGRIAIPHERARPWTPPPALRGHTVAVAPCVAELGRCACPATRLLDRAAVRTHGTTPRLLAAYAAARAARF